MSCRNTPRTPKNPIRNATPKSSSKPPRKRDFSSESGKLLNTAFSVENRSAKKRIHLPPATDSFTTSTTTPKRENPRYFFTPECFANVSMDASGKVAGRTSAGQEEGQEVSNLTVAVRVRPMNKQELTMSGVGNVIQVENNEVTVLAGTSADSSNGITRGFVYDCAFWSCNSQHHGYADQKAIFDSIGAPLVDRAFEGYNVCLFAYGQTSSGKSYSMMGIDTGDSDVIHPNSEVGIIPRFCHELFRRIDAMGGKIMAEVEVSYFEIYNEKIHDLLSVSSSRNTTPNGRKSALRVREHALWGPYVVDLSAHPVDSYAALKTWMILGNSQRATAATGMNDKSSRSHSIFNIVLNLWERGDDKRQQTRRSKISLVDLAGSERMNPTCTSADRLKEGISINRSLLTLGKVIAALATSKKGSLGHIPYRESVLTWLLKENLGGNSKTVMLATISPASIHLEETLATLRYACQARAIVNRVKVNEDPHDKIIRELRAEVERLQVLQQDYERQQQRNAVTETGAVRHIVIETSGGVDERELEKLRKELSQSKQELAKAQRSWMERLREAESMRKSEMEVLKRKGLTLGSEVSRKETCLVNLDPDHILSGTLVFRLPLGKVKLGRNHPTSKEQPDIVLEGPLVSFNHCAFENNAGILYLTPLSLDFETFVNGQLIDGRTELHHGDRVIIGGSHYFRVSNPAEGRPDEALFDFHQAHLEFQLEQEKRLREEVDAEKRNAEREMQKELDSLQREVERLRTRKECVEVELEMLKDCAERPDLEVHRKSNILADLQNIMMHPSEDSLHKIQLQVKEATQRCRDFGLREFEFRQSQVCDEFGLFKAVVNIVDRRSKRVADWPPARLEVWLEMMRNAEMEPSRVFEVLDVEWRSLDEANENALNESINSGKRISLSLSSRLGNRTPPSRIKSALSSSHKKSGTPLSARNQTPGDFPIKARPYLKDLNVAMSCLKNLCCDDQMSNRSREMLGMIDEMDEIVGRMTHLIREKDSEAKTPKTPKSVRFRFD
ncbi:kinesin-like protein KIF14 [Phlebotomus argentipes]|uniref:kinesin-like protein KIF14 n=1 Tax=Phlebotomus argentipes TaxID=94469 RepID=UPI0028937269|nr:kinesin-like protein KIF14 [Phlebotomus argentipes]